MRFERYGLEVTVRVLKDGRMRPLSISAENRVYTIDRITAIKRRCPEGIACIAPLEYTVVVEGIVKKLYYEGDTNTWFSAKMVVDPL